HTARNACPCIHPKPELPTLTVARGLINYLNGCKVRDELPSLRLAGDSWRQRLKLSRPHHPVINNVSGLVSTKEWDKAGGVQLAHHTGIHGFEFGGCLLFL